MEEKNKNYCEVCGSGNGRCGSCGHYCGFGGAHIVRWILGIIIITWVFSIGMKMGEIKAALEGSGYYSSPRMFRVDAPMMYGTSGSASSGNVFFSTAVPAQGGTPTTGVVQIKK